MIYLTISLDNVILNNDLFNDQVPQDRVRQFQHTAVWRKFQPLCTITNVQMPGNEGRRYLHRSPGEVQVTILRNLYNFFLFRSECVYTF